MIKVIIDQTIDFYPDSDRTEATESTD